MVKSLSGLQGHIIDEKLVYLWHSDQNLFLKMLKTKRWTGVVAWPIVEENLEKWILERCSTVKIYIPSKNMEQQMRLKIFVGSSRRCHGFMARERLSLLQNNHWTKATEWLAQKKKSFFSHTEDIIQQQKLSIAQMIKMDEVAFTFDIPSNRSV